MISLKRFIFSYLLFASVAVMCRELLNEPEDPTGWRIEYKLNQWTVSAIVIQVDMPVIENSISIKNQWHVWGRPLTDIENNSLIKHLNELVVTNINNSCGVCIHIIKETRPRRYAYDTIIIQEMNTEDILKVIEKYRAQQYNSDPNDSEAVREYMQRLVWRQALKQNGTTERVGNEIIKRLKQPPKSEHVRAYLIELLEKYASRLLQRHIFDALEFAENETSVKVRAMWLRLVLTMSANLNMALDLDKCGILVEKYARWWNNEALEKATPLWRTVYAQAAYDALEWVEYSLPLVKRCKKEHDLKQIDK